MCGPLQKYARYFERRSTVRRSTRDLEMRDGLIHATHTGPHHNTAHDIALSPAGSECVVRAPTECVRARLRRASPIKLQRGGRRRQAARNRAQCGTSRAHACIMPGYDVRMSDRIQRPTRGLRSCARRRHNGLGRLETTHTHTHTPPSPPLFSADDGFVLSGHGSATH